MQADPFRGDTKALKGNEWKGLYRKRVGPFRIIFTADRPGSTVGIAAILRRSEKTYR
jgi:mRNA-degrading endonuclease RelE of RelBE toxin-antitoxin system